MAREEQLKQEKKYAPGVSRELALAEKTAYHCLLIMKRDMIVISLREFGMPWSRESTFDLI